ncbi:MAG: restriction endonuclease subunit S [Comamonas sp.]|nr:restriction endonuclease subunit S [Comamonas sp.]
MSVQVPKGYKQTEVGVIPEDWLLVTANDVCDLVIDCKNRTPPFSESEDYAVVRTPNVRDGKFVWSDLKFTDKKSFEIWTSRGVPSEGDILITREAPLGEACLVPEKINVCLGQRMMLYRPCALKINGQYMLYAILSNNVQKTLFKKIGGSTVGHAKVDDIRYLQISMPNKLEEQQAIAEALSDADALIESLEQLITKKRQVKQGAMQELLTGQRRLPGFSGGWVVKRLEELADIRSGGTPSTSQPQFWDGDVLWCTPTDITALNGGKYIIETSRKITVAGLKASSAEIIPAGSIVMTSRATIGECAININPITTNQGFKNFVPFDSVDTEFLYYLLSTQREGFVSLCSGSTFLEIGKNQLMTYEVLIPNEKSEQTAIAIILADMDKEIEGIEARLSKARKIKQSMMQELLTGRIRLI